MSAKRREKRITDTMRLNSLLRFMNADPVISMNGYRKWYHHGIDAAIRAARRQRGQKK